jgi:hypothetical protein
MVKMKTIILLLIFAGNAYAISNADLFVPKGWQKGNGLAKDPFPFYIKANIDEDSENEIILHCSYKEKGDYLPSKHILSIFDWNGNKYYKKWSSSFNAWDHIFFLIDDLNKDKKPELIINGYNSGNAGLGHLWIFQLTKSNPTVIFDKDVQGDIYLWDSEKLAPGLEPAYFPDLDRDGISEILIGYSVPCENVSRVDEPWWFDIYRWNGKTYILANDRFPEFYKEQFAIFRAWIKENGENSQIRKLIEKAEKFAKR